MTFEPYPLRLAYAIIRPSVKRDDAYQKENDVAASRRLPRKIVSAKLGERGSLLLSDPLFRSVSCTLETLQLINATSFFQLTKIKPKRDGKILKNERKKEMGIICVINELRISLDAKDLSKPPAIPKPPLGRSIH